MIDTIIIIIAAYALGSVPCGVLLARSFGLPDPRGLGSGNIGATNMLRTGRKDVALLTLLLDATKGAAPVVAVASLWGGGWTLQALALLAAVLGHCYSPWLKFSGGKGVATTLGGVLALNLSLGIALCILWLVVWRSTWLVSLASVAAAVALPFLAAGWLELNPAWVLALIAVIVVVKHRSNITRLRAGTEPKVGGKNRA